MSNVPPAARRQIKAANEQIQALREGRDPFAAAPAPAASAAQSAATPAPNVAISPVPDFPVVGASLPTDAVPTNQPAPAATPAPAPAASAAPPADATGMPAQPADTAEHRYKVLQGKYQAETKRNSQRISSLEEQNAQLIAQLARQPVAPPAAPAAPAAPQTLEERAAALGITKDEVKEYGAELIELIMRTAQNITAPEIRRLAAEQQRLSGAVNTTVQHVNRTARELVYDALATQVPGWEATNDSPEFLDWLETVDIFSGQTRKAGLMRAFENNDATRVVGIFKAFLKEDERSRSTAGPRVDPATLVAPGQPAGSGSPAPQGGTQDKRIWTEQEVGNFYSLVRQRKIPEDQRKAIEAEIHLALVENRIRPTVNDQGIANAR